MYGMYAARPEDRGRRDLDELAGYITPTPVAELGDDAEVVRDQAGSWSVVVRRRSPQQIEHLGRIVTSRAP